MSDAAVTTSTKKFKASLFLLGRDDAVFSVDLEMATPREAAQKFKQTYLIDDAYQFELSGTLYLVEKTSVSRIEIKDRGFGAYVPRATRPVDTDLRFEVKTSEE